MPSDPGPPVRPRRRFHFGSPELVYIFVTLLLALGAFNSQNNLLFWAFGFSLAILIVSGLFSGAMLMGIEVRRERIADGQVGLPMPIRYRVRNRNRFVPAFALTIEELPAVSAPGGPGSTVPATTARLDQPRAFAAHVGPRETIVVATSPRAVKRGPIAFRGFVVHTAFPFGLIRKSLVYADPASAVIRPAPATDAPADILEPVASGASERTGRLRGPGDEFHSLREYNPGDNPRAIAWKASARRGTLLVRQSLAPAPRRLWVVLRLRVDPAGNDDRDERAISLAAAIIKAAQADELAVGLAVPLARVVVPPGARPGHADRLLRELGLIELGPADTRGALESFPRISAGRAAGQCLCIHAGPIDPSFAPGDGAGRAIHLSALGPSPSATAPSRSTLPVSAPVPA